MLYYLDQPVPPSIQAYLQSFDSPHLKYVNEKTHEDKNETLRVSKSTSLPRQRSKTFNKNKYEAYRPQSATLFRETKRKACAKFDDKQPQRQQKSNTNNRKSKSLTDLSKCRRSLIPRKIDQSTPEKQENHLKLDKTFPFYKTIHDENDNLIGKERYEIPMKSLSKGDNNIRHKRCDSVSSNTSFESTSTNISMVDIDYSDNSFIEASPPYGKRPASAPGFLRKSSISKIPRARRSFKNLPFSNFSHLNKYREEKPASPRYSLPSSPQNKKLPDLRNVTEHQPEITSFNNLPRSKSEIDLALLRTKSNEKRSSSSSRSGVVHASNSIDRLNVMYANEHAYFHCLSTIKRNQNDNDNDSTYSSLLYSLESQSLSLSEDISKVFYLVIITILCPVPRSSEKIGLIFS